MLENLRLEAELADVVVAGRAEVADHPVFGAFAWLVAGAQTTVSVGQLVADPVQSLACIGHRVKTRECAGMALNGYLVCQLDPLKNPGLQAVTELGVWDRCGVVRVHALYAAALIANDIVAVNVRPVAGEGLHGVVLCIPAQVALKRRFCFEAFSPALKTAQLPPIGALVAKVVVTSNHTTLLRRLGFGSRNRTVYFDLGVFETLRQILLPMFQRPALFDLGCLLHHRLRLILGSRLAAICEA